MSTSGDLTTENTISGGTDGASIGNINDKLKVSVDSLLLSGIDYNKITIAYPDNTTEIYSYYESSVLKCTVTIIYSNASKRQMVSIERL